MPVSAAPPAGSAGVAALCTCLIIAIVAGTTTQTALCLEANGLAKVQSTVACGVHCVGHRLLALARAHRVLHWGGVASFDAFAVWTGHPFDSFILPPNLFFSSWPPAQRLQRGGRRAAQWLCPGWQGCRWRPSAAPWTKWRRRWRRSTRSRPASSARRTRCASKGTTPVCLAGVLPMSPWSAGQDRRWPRFCCLPSALAYDHSLVPPLPPIRGHKPLLWWRLLPFCTRHLYFPASSRVRCRTGGPQQPVQPGLSVDAFEGEEADPAGCHTCVGVGHGGIWPLFLGTNSFWLDDPAMLSIGPPLGVFLFDLKK